VRDADVVLIGPGDLYTSLIPNLLVKGMPEALKESKAKKAVVCNLMTKWGETHGFTATDMVKELLAYSGLDRFDVAICNTEPVSEKLIQAYEEHKQFPMTFDESLNQYVSRVIAGEFVSEADIARHDTDALAKVIVEM